MAISGKLAPDYKLRQVELFWGHFWNTLPFYIQKSTKNNTFFTEKGVKITVFQSNLKNFWNSIFGGRLLIDCSSTFFIQYYIVLILSYMLKRQGILKMALELAYFC